MGEIVLIAAVAAFFAFGFFVIHRFGEFADKSCPEKKKAQKHDRKVYIVETAGKSAESIAGEVRALLDSLPNREDCKIILLSRYMNRSANWR